LVLHILSAEAEDEVKRIRTRIREALAAKKRRGEKVGKSGRALKAMQWKGADASAKARRGERSSGIKNRSTFLIFGCTDGFILLAGKSTRRK